MKAVVYDKYGPPEVLHIKDVEKPEPEDDQVLIKVHATTVTKYDTWQRSGYAPTGFKALSRSVTGISKPKQPILGTELAGEVVDKGKEVTKFNKGDQVFAFLGMNLGVYVEYITLSENSAVTTMPGNMSYQESAAVQQGALTAFYFLKRAEIEKGQKVLIFGASGGVGRPAVQLAKHFGAEVTGVCSTSKVDLVKSLGADKVIDYKKQDFTENSEKYDVIFDTVGKTSVNRSKKSLKDNGHFLFTTFDLPKLTQIFWLSLTSNRKTFYGTLKETAGDLEFLKQLVESGELTVVIDKVFTFEQTAEAHKYFESGQQKGNVVISVAKS